MTERRPYYIQSDYTGYPAAVGELNARYMDYPRVVSVETQVKCNAACLFCPYPVSPRKGQELSERLFLKIIDDLSVIPRNHDFLITLHRINEPLLDNRMEKFHKVIAEKLPSARQGFWSNGTSLTKGNLEWMVKYKGASLSVSLNSIDEDEHIRMMGFGLESVFKGLDYLHGLAEAGDFPLSVSLLAPFISDHQACHFHNVCDDMWPLFKTGIRPFFKWMGSSDRGSEYRETHGFEGMNEAQIVDYPCGQWCDIHVLANGYVTKCCIDEVGFDGNPEFDVRKHHVLDIYKKGRWKREKLQPRGCIDDCGGCLHLG